MKSLSSPARRALLAAALVIALAASSVGSAGAAANDAAPAPLTRTDTGLTMLRVSITTTAVWTEVNFEGMTVRQARVVSRASTMAVTNFGGNAIGVAGRGTGVFELLVAIAPGASPSLKMCKNYLGPATVTIERITAAPVVVATVTNTSTSWQHPLGTCEGQLRQSLSRPDLMGAVRWPARVDARPLVLAAYHPWWTAASLNHTFGDQPVGPARTDGPYVVRAAVDLAATNGIDGFLVDYGGWAEDAALDRVYEAATARGGFQVAEIVDLSIARGRNGGRLTQATVDALLASVTARAGRPSQLRVGNQPVLFVYGANLVDPAIWRRALATMQANLGVAPFVVADDPVLAPQGLYQYGTYNVPLGPWSDDMLLRRRLTPSFNRQTLPLWVAPVSPGYDDHLLARAVSTIIPRAAGTRYQQAWTAALGTLPDWVLVSSWNEYYEQTHVMPGSTSGTTALDQTRAFSADFHRTG